MEAPLPFGTRRKRRISGALKEAVARAAAIGSHGRTGAQVLQNMSRYQRRLMGGVSQGQRLDEAQGGEVLAACPSFLPVCSLLNLRTFHGRDQGRLQGHVLLCHVPAGGPKGVLAPTAGTSTNPNSTAAIAPQAPPQARRKRGIWPPQTRRKNREMENFLRHPKNCAAPQTRRKNAETAPQARRKHRHREPRDRATGDP